MRTRYIAALAAAAALCVTASAQTNLQIQYDFGSDRQQITTTLEGFYNDNWGNTFFFVDYDYRLKPEQGSNAPDGTYFEIARCLNFWQNSKLAPFSLQVEYNGGVYKGFNIGHAFLTGVDWFTHSADFKKTLNLKVLYKYINYDDIAFKGLPYPKSKVPMQFTAVWGLQDIFGVTGLNFSGFADFWWEEHFIYEDSRKKPISPELCHTVFISEPQLWYNVGRHFGCENLNLGGEIELSWNFGSCAGFRARPCLGAKWVF